MAPRILKDVDVAFQHVLLCWPLQTFIDHPLKILACQGQAVIASVATLYTPGNGTFGMLIISSVKMYRMSG
jgi:hypothetical protein